MQKLKQKQKTRSIRNVALGLLSRREHSVLELGRKLKSKGFSPQEIEPELQSLQAERLLSNERYTESYVHMRRQRGYGPLRIVMELRERGIDAQLAEHYLDIDNSNWLELLREQYVKKYGSSTVDSYEEKVKRVKYLQNRGFAIDWILKSLSGLEMDTDGQENS